MGRFFPHISFCFIWYACVFVSGLHNQLKQQQHFTLTKLFRSGVFEYFLLLPLLYLSLSLSLSLPPSLSSCKGPMLSTLSLFKFHFWPLSVYAAKFLSFTLPTFLSVSPKERRKQRKSENFNNKIRVDFAEVIKANCMPKVTVT